MSELKRLKARGASEDEAKGAVRVLFPKQTINHQSYRSRFMRLFKASDADFQKALKAWKAGDHVDKILKLIPVTGRRGAPVGNLNAIGKKRSVSSLDRMIGMWRAATPNDQKAFLKYLGFCDSRKPL